jgi:hypothetical protein
LDLITVSDFAGLDAFENNGKGVFTDSTSGWFQDTKAFGMAHALADFNHDGKLDFLMIGMDSPTADRLESLGLRRPYDSDDTGMRARVSYGNRLYYGSGDGEFIQTAPGEKVARTGWSWGCAAQDFDNDGFPDLYIANGHESRQSVRDYETEFWLHDIYMRPASENPLSQKYFQEKYQRTRGTGWSYGGYEKNRFYLNLGGTNFIEAGYLFGLALEADSRNVVAADLTGDGKLDLIVTTFEAYPATRQTVRIYENKLRQTGNWLEIGGLKSSDIGHVFGSESSGKRLLVPLVTGDSYRAQSPQVLHIGLGAATHATIRREPDGPELQVDQVNRRVNMRESPGLRTR